MGRLKFASRPSRSGLVRHSRIQRRADGHAQYGGSTLTRLAKPAAKATTNWPGALHFFSWAPIPLVRDDPKRSARPRITFHSFGSVYLYTRDPRELTALPTGILEDAEKLEQLRALENGIRIRVWEPPMMSLRIDSPRTCRSPRQLRAHTSRTGHSTMTIGRIHRRCHDEQADLCDRGCRIRRSERDWRLRPSAICWKTAG